MAKELTKQEQKEKQLKLKQEQKEASRKQKEAFKLEMDKTKEKFDAYKANVKETKENSKIELNGKIDEAKAKLVELNSAEEKDIEKINEQKSLIKDLKKELNARLNKGYFPIDPSIAIELRGAYKYYTSSDVITKVIDNLSLKINRDETTIILGPSGSGKTTLLNLISGLDKPSAGDVITNNHNLSWIKERKLINFRKENISFIFQQYNLIPTLNIEDNIRTGFEIKNPNVEPIDVEELMKKINIWDSRKKYPYQLSGGQLQRTAIARALAKNPDIIFADEPTGALDEDMSKEVLEILIDITKQYKKTLVIVTHNPQIAKIGNRVLRFGNGKIVKDEVNKKPTNPKDLSW